MTNKERDYWICFHKICLCFEIIAQTQKDRIKDIEMLTAQMRALYVEIESENKSSMIECGKKIVEATQAEKDKNESLLDFVAIFDEMLDSKILDVYAND